MSQKSNYCLGFTHLLSKTIFLVLSNSYIVAMIRLLLVDDHHESRQQIIPELKAGNLINVIGEAQTSDEALQMSEKLLPDIVLLRFTFARTTQTLQPYSKIKRFAQR